MIVVLFRKDFRFMEFILTLANCVIFTLDLENRKSRHCLRDFLFCQIVKARRPQTGPYVSRSHMMVTQVAIVRMKFLDLKT